MTESGMPPLDCAVALDAEDNAPSYDGKLGPLLSLDSSLLFFPVPLFEFVLFVLRL